MVKFFRNWLPALLFAGLIFGFSGMSSPPGASLAPDYVAHAIEYGVFALTLAWGLTAGGSRPFTLLRALVAASLAIAFALTDELHQAFVPGRSPDWRDIISDAVGAALFVGAAFLIARWRWAASSRAAE